MMKPLYPSRSEDSLSGRTSVWSFLIWRMRLAVSVVLRSQTGFGSPEKMSSSMRSMIPLGLSVRRVTLPRVVLGVHWGVPIKGVKSKPIGVE